LPPQNFNARFIHSACTIKMSHGSQFAEPRHRKAGLRKVAEIVITGLKAVAF